MSRLSYFVGCAAVAVVAAASASSVSAQERPSSGISQTIDPSQKTQSANDGSGRPASSQDPAKAYGRGFQPRPPQEKILVLTGPFSNPAGYIKLPAMSGWTAITEKPIKGRPEIARVGGDIFALMTSEANEMFAVKLDAATLEPVATTWSKVASDVTSAADCAERNVLSDYEFNFNPGLLCYTLAPGGSAAAHWLALNQGVLTNEKSENLGGSNAGAVPTHTGVGPLVWDGATGVFYRAFPFNKNQFVKFDTNATQPIICDSETQSNTTSPSFYCYNFINFYQHVKGKEALDGSLIGFAPPSFPEARPELSGATPRADVISGIGFFQLDNQGQLFFWKNGSTQSTANWKNLGGKAMVGSSPSCKAIGPNVVCAMQASDGRAYVRLINSQGSL